MKKYTGFLLLLASGSALAGNGLYDISFGAASIATGGADLAMIDDTAALMINPARLTAIKGHRLDAFVEPSIYFDNRHQDAFGNDVAPDNRLTVPFGGGYVQRIGDSAFTAGVGLFFQGGAGLVYDDLQTAFGTRDRASSLLGSIRVTPGIGWQVNEQLSLGLSLGVNYSIARQKFFPDTSIDTPQVSFAGFRVDDLAGFSLGARAGLQYDLNDRWSFALTYAPKTPIKLESGTLQSNYEATGLGRVRYAKANIDGLCFASDLSLGAAWKPTSNWQFAAKFSWLDWSRSMRSSTLHASQPDKPSAPATLAFVSDLNWRDQYVIAIGTRWQWTPTTQLRAGFNYGRAPVDEQYLTPTLAMISSSAAAVGISHQISPHWLLDLTAQYHLPRSVRYTNETAPFGPDAKERWDAGAVLISVSRLW